jgi:CubicO group peptidase (beta-lactamase class C family)
VYYASSKSAPYDYAVERMDAHGGWLASPVDIMRFMVRYDGRTPPTDLLQKDSISEMTSRWHPSASYARGWGVNKKSTRWSHSGALSGTRSQLVRDSDDFNWFIVINTKTDKDADGYISLNTLGSQIKKAVSGWPTYDLF